MKKNEPRVFDFHQRLKSMLTILRICLLFISVPLSSLQAENVEQSGKITLKMNATIDELIKSVRTETAYKFLYRVEEVQRYGNRTVDVKEASIEVFLQKMLADTQLSYEIDNGVIIIRPVSGRQTTEQGVVLVKGRVIAENGTPLPGVTVVIKGTGLGVSSDVDGYFKIEIPRQDSAVLVFSFMGMETVVRHLKIPASGNIKEISVTMKEKLHEMDEVVVTGFANIRKESFTGSSVNVKKEDLLKVSKTNVIKALQVFDPSFRIQENNQWGSDPNALPEMYIRGRSGIGIKELDKGQLTKSNLENNPNLPLFIMDGFQVDIQKVYDFDPNRIEGITILKDAAATAMYGSRAANGVVVITTVPPKPGKVNVSYSMTGTLSVPDLRDYHLMNAREKLATEVAAHIYESDDIFKQIQLDKEYNAKLTNIREGVDTYWLSQPLQTVFNHKHSIFIEGGHEDLRFGLNLLYSNNDGVMKESYRNNTGAEFSVSYRVGTFQIKNKTGYQQTRTEESPYGSFSEYTKKLPYDRTSDEFGNFTKETYKWNQELTQSDLVNPLWEATLDSYNRGKSDILENELGMNWHITPYLLAKGTFKIQKTTSDRKNFTDPKSKRNPESLSITNLKSGLLNTTDGKGASWEYTANIAYNQIIRQHNINFNAGINGASNKAESLNVLYRGFPSGQLSSPNYAQETVNKPVSARDESHLLGVIGLLNYSYNNIYLVDASIRCDGSSKFGNDNRWAIFWSAGGGINLHNYEWLKKKDWMSLLKVRATYGLTGNVSFSPYEAQTMYKIQNDEWYKTGYGATVIAFGNDNLGWERKYKTNFGLDFEIFKGALKFSGDYYVERTVDLVNDVTIPSSAGFTTYKDNMGEVKGKGYEITLRSTLLNSRDWGVNVYANLSHDKRKFVKIAESLKAYNKLVEEHFEKEDPYDGEVSLPFIQYQEGGSLTPVFGMRSYGIDPANGEEMLVKRNGDITYIWNTSEQVVLGDTEPDAQGSFGFNLRYKNLTLFASFMYRFGGQYYNSTLVEKVENANIYRHNADKRVLSDRWQKAGDRAKYRKLEAGVGNIAKTQPTERFVQNDNVLSLNSLSLSYDFNPDLLKHAGISMMRLEVGANELFRWSSVKAERGLSYPFARSVDVTLNVTF